MDVPELSTQHLKLRGWRPDDVDALAAIMSDPDVTRHLDEAPRDHDEVAGRVAEFIAEWRAHGFGRWAVEETATGALIGLCGFRRYDRAVGDFTAVIARDRQGRGLGSEAARAALRYAFEALKFRRVQAVVHPANRAAQRVLEKLGMSHTESAVRAHGVRVMVYSLTELERRMRAR